MVWDQKNHVRGTKIALLLRKYYSLYGSELVSIRRVIHHRYVGQMELGLDLLSNLRKLHFSIL